jgi:hypothetical protein
MNETVSSMKTWALGKAVAVLEKSGFEKAAALSDKLKVKEEDAGVKNAITREETNTNHRLRRLRLWCLYIQAECFLFIGFLTVRFHLLLTILTIFAVLFLRSWGC